MEVPFLSIHTDPIISRHAFHCLNSSHATSLIFRRCFQVFVSNSSNSYFEVISFSSNSLKNKQSIKRKAKKRMFLSFLQPIHITTSPFREIFTRRSNSITGQNTCCWFFSLEFISNSVTVSRCSIRRTDENMYACVDRQSTCSRWSWKFF